MDGADLDFDDYSDSYYAFLDFDATEGTNGTLERSTPSNATCLPFAFYLPSLGCEGSRAFFVGLYSLCLVLLGVVLLYVRYLYLHFYPHVQGDILMIIGFVSFCTTTYSFIQTINIGALIKNIQQTLLGKKESNEKNQTRIPLRER